jgi:hypothetical protein
VDTMVDHRRELLETLVAPFRAYALYAAVKLGIPDRIRDGLQTTAALAEVVDADPASLRRLLRVLSFQHVLDTADFEEYSLAAAGELLCSDHPSHLSDLVLLYGEQAYPSFAHIVHCVRTGEAGFPLVFGTTFLEYYKQNPEAGRTFDRAMAAGNAFFASLPSVVDIPDGATIVDVGGGDGSLLEALLTAFPTARGMVAEERTDAAEARFARSPVGSRAEARPTNFFDSVPEGGQVYVLSRILHDWDDDDCVRILTACRKAMEPGTTLLIVERVIGLPDERSLAVDWDLHMMVNTGGAERTLDEYQTLLSRAGFAYRDNASLPQSVMVLRSTAG